jgi:hypothetical protein
VSPLEHMDVLMGTAGPGGAPSAVPGGPPGAAAAAPPLVVGVPAKPARNPTAFAGAHLGVPASPLEAFVSTDVRDYMWPTLTPQGEKETTYWLAPILAAPPRSARGKAGGGGFRRARSYAVCRSVLSLVKKTLAMPGLTPGAGAREKRDQAIRRRAGRQALSGRVLMGGPRPRCLPTLGRWGLAPACHARQSSPMSRHLRGWPSHLGTPPSRHKRDLQMRARSGPFLTPRPSPADPISPRSRPRRRRLRAVRTPPPRLSPPPRPRALRPARPGRGGRWHARPPGCGQRGRGWRWRRCRHGRVRRRRRVGPPLPWAAARPRVRPPPPRRLASPLGGVRRRRRRFSRG